MKPAGGASGAEGKLGRTQPLIGAGAAGGRAVAITTADCMTSALAERNTEVAPARQQRAEVVQRDLLLCAPVGYFMVTQLLHVNKIM